MKNLKKIIRKQLQYASTRYIKTKLIKYYPEEYKGILKFSNFLGRSKEISFVERLYCVLNDITKKVLCLECKKEFVNFWNFKEGYHAYCSKRCKATSKIVQRKMRNTMFEKYGATHTFCLDKHRKNATEKLQSKYKEDKTFKKKIYKKRELTNLKRYGEAAPMNCKNIQQKKKQTMLKKYGVEHSSQYNKSVEKMKQTNLENYGCEFPMQNKDIINKCRKTKIKNGTTGYIYPAIGKNEKGILDCQERIDRCEIDRKFIVLNYHPDGYCHKTNTIYEVYEKRHKYPKRKKHDLKRQAKIQKELDCEFVIIWDLTH